jgi:hypothetical protein
MTVKRTLGVAAALLVATAVIAGPASAESHQLSGRIHGDSDAIASMKIVMGKGKPREARNLKLAGLDYACNDGTAGERTFVTKSIDTRGQDGRDGREGFILDVVAHDANWKISGLVADDGKKVRGMVYYSFQNEAGSFCTSKPGASIFGAKPK